MSAYVSGATRARRCEHAWEAILGGATDGAAVVVVVAVFLFKFWRRRLRSGGTAV